LDSVEVLLEEVTALLARLAAPRRHHIASGLQLEDGRIFTGINLVSNFGPSSVCAEQIVLGEGLKTSASPVELILTLRATFRPEPPFEVVSPCGRCREILIEFAPTVEVVVPKNASTRSIDLIPIGDLLPVPFVRRSPTYSKYQKLDN
jgi:cytidine deaminase